METIDKIFFAEFEVDVEANALIKNGRSRRLEPKTIELLCLFLERPHQTLSRETILEAVWPDVIVGDEVVNRAVFNLRNALGDDAKNPIFIETISKKGYRFLVKPQEEAFDKFTFEPKITLPAEQENKEYKGSMRELSDSLSQGSENQGSENLGIDEQPLAISTAKASPPPTHTKKAQALWRQVKVYSGVGVLAICIIFAIAYIYENAIGNSPIKSIAPVTQREGSEKNLVVNAAGDKAYVHDIGDRTDLWVDSANGGKVQVTNDWERQKSPIWMKGKDLYFVRCAGSGCGVNVFRDGAGAKTFYSTERKIYHMSRFGEEALLLIESFTKTRTRLTVLDINTGEYWFLRDRYPSLPDWISHAEVSRDGRFLYFAVGNQSYLEINKLDLDKAEMSAYPIDFMEINDVSPGDSDSIWVAGTKDGENGIWKLQEGHAELVLRASTTESIVGVSYKPEAHQLYYENYRNNINLEYFGTESDAIDLLQSLNSNVDEDDASFSKDGRSAFYVSNRSGSREVWRYDFDSKTTQQITQTHASHAFRPIVSDDNALLLFAYKTQGWKLGVFSLTDKTQKEVFEISGERFPIAWSRDKQYFYTTEYNQGFRIRRYNRTDGSSVIFHEGAWMNLSESADGKYAIFPVHGRELLAKKHIESGELEWLDVNVQAQDLELGQLVMTPNAAFGLRYDGPARWVVKYPYIGKQEDIMRLPDWVWVSYIRSDGNAVILEKPRMPQGDVMKIQL